jgi:hydrogenase maturation protein HypF
MLFILGCIGDSEHLKTDMPGVQRLAIKILGAVQGVGFRPFIYRLATEIQVTGWVLNSPQGVFIEVEGERQKLDSFLLRIEKEKPQRSFIQSLESSFLDFIGYSNFEIRHSDAGGEPTAIVLPDIATCPDCLQEILDASNRHYLYPFTNCTNCGPRFSIIESLPYDRANTSMANFGMCDDCRREYENPLDRRFHAQPNACPKCGPSLEYWSPDGKTVARHHEALLLAVEDLREGKIVAIKGLGGFHFMVDARNEEAVVRLRARKHREEKPFASMYPSLRAVKEHCEVSQLEERLLLSPESPIVLLKRTARFSGRNSDIAPSVAPGNPYLGVMLPYTPLHYLLMREVDFPVIATSGNLSDEPICTDEHEALRRLGSIADTFLVHNRPIRRHVDDSIVRVMMGRELVVRRARGYAPLPIRMKAVHEFPLLAVGAHLKNTIAVTSGDNVFVSQHIGDLETNEAYQAFLDVTSSLEKLYNIRPAKIIADMHPGYLSTQYALETGVHVEQVQHHYAHIASCMAENGLDGPALGVAWDGTGYGTDGTIWGGEFFLVSETSFERVASMRPFRLPGGELSIREPRRTALGLLYELFAQETFGRTGLAPLQSFRASELNILHTMLARNLNSPLTSSVGRLFDAVASLTGLRQHVSFEGQAAMELEFLTADTSTQESYDFSIVDRRPASDRNRLRVEKRSSVENQFLIIIDWGPLICGILDDTENNVPNKLIAAKFHNTLAEMIVAVAGRGGERRVVLSGGCFQNKYLTEQTVRRLEEEGFRPYWHQRIPPNDGGIALGQVAAASRGIRAELNSVPYRISAGELAV